MTPYQIREFQRTHNNWHGLPLDVDGSIGPQTSWALAIDALPGLERKYVALALGELRAGVVERTGTNDHPRITLYQELCHAPPGSPWCAAFGSWCAVQAGADLMPDASVARLSKQFEPLNDPVLGGVAWWVRPDGTGHWITAVLGIDTFDVMCLEGNSANRIRLCTRPIHGLKFGRLPRQRHIARVAPGLPVAKQDVAGTR